MFHLPYTDGVPRESTTLKCTNCKETTEHESLKIVPVPDDVSMDPLEVLKLSKRMVICTKCGLLKTVN